MSSVITFYFRITALTYTHYFRMIDFKILIKSEITRFCHRNKKQTNRRKGEKYKRSKGQSVEEKKIEATVVCYPVMDYILFDACADRAA